MKKRLLFLAAAMLIVSMVFSACAPKAAATTAVTEAPPAATEAQPVATEQPTTSVAPVGGTLIWGIEGEPDTLDPNKTSMGVSDLIMQFIGGSLVWMTMDWQYVPYLAESWTISADGLVWEFKLRHDVKFSDGTPLTAQDYAWTFQRALDPATASPGTGPMLGAVDTIEAVDDYTLRLTLKEPNAPLIYALADPGYTQPINKAAFESMGADTYGRSPMSVGPYVFKEWVTSEHITLERNPDYTWGPATEPNKGPFNIQTIEFRIIPDHTTVISGLESGEIDFAAILPKDVADLQGTGNMEIMQWLGQGINPYVVFNLERAPFNDVRVRQAFNLAVDRQALIDLVVQGNGELQGGYLSKSVMGYWPGGEALGYGFDLPRAKQLMADAGYTPGTDGILQKDGVPLSIKMLAPSNDENLLKTAQVLQEQYKTLGVEIEITQQDFGTLYTTMASGDFDIGMMGMGYGEADLLYFNFHSSNIGGLNVSRLNDPEIDALLTQQRAATDVSQRQAILDQIQQKVIEEAYVVFLFTQTNFEALNTRIKGGAFWNVPLISLNISSAYIEP
jgi:peptide/nickel transport system substrate-binding protein